MMRNFLPTETVIFRIIRKLPPNEIGETLVDFDEYSVPGCLVQPGVSQELGEGFELNQVDGITVHVPSWFKKDLTAGEAEVRGRKFKVLVDQLSYTFSPLQWDRAVILEAAR